MATLRAAFLMLLLLAAFSCTLRRGTTETDLAAYVESVKAIDTHAHPMSAVTAGTAPDTDYDALPLDGLPPFALPAPLRPDNPAFHDAQRALYDLSSTDTGSGYARALKAARTAAMQQRGASFPSWVLDRAGIEMMLANRVAMGPGLVAPRFRWVAFADALMLPLDGQLEARRTPDTRTLYPLESKLLHRYLHDLGLTSIPRTLAEYKRAVLLPTLTAERAAGAVAIKFEAAYLRPLNFAPADAEVAAAIYARYSAGGTPSADEYKTLQDYLFRAICGAAGRLGLAVQVHSLDGFGGFYSAAGAAPSQLESALSDSTLLGTNVVIVHGGWPRVDETLALLSRPNVYADISMMDLVADPAALVRTLRLWLTAWPDKVMFGTDAFDGGTAQGWEQVAWVAARNARRGLVDALNGMVHDGQVSPARARQIARMVLRENAIVAYHLGETAH